MITCHQCQYPNQTEVEVCNYCGDFADSNNVYYKYLALEEVKSNQNLESNFSFDGLNDNLKADTLFERVSINLVLGNLVFLIILLLALLFFKSPTNQFLGKCKFCFSVMNTEVCIPLAIVEGTFFEIEKIKEFNVFGDKVAYYMNHFMDAMSYSLLSFIYWFIITIIASYLFVHPITYLIEKRRRNLNTIKNLKNIQTKLNELKPQYEKLKLLLNTNAKHLKQAISTSYLQIIRLNYELMDTEKTIDESQNSRVISEQERSQILENLKSIQQQLKTNYSKFVAHFTELKLIYHLSYFELLRVNYEKEGEVDEQEIDTLINEIKKTEDFILPIASKDEKVKLGKFKSLVLKYKKLDDREALQAKLAKVSTYIKKGQAQINPEISGDLDFEFMLAESYDKYHEKYWNDYEKLLVLS